ncbi:MAG: fumarylacetoacetate hydrolase family protein [Candidatus Odyssella sp.]|nr:fumarylacetoacetate hydrolase family protein [Candidatus Odyssella sp.]
MTFALATAEIDGRPEACLQTGGKLYPVAAAAARLGLHGLGGNLVALFDEWDKSFAALSALAAKAPGACADLARGSAPLLAPLRYPGKVLCAGANYYDHIAEMGVQDTRKEAQRLFFFFKPPRNAVVGPGRTVRMPLDTKAMDWEIELAAIIGRPARAVSEKDAMAAVAAYTVAIDFSARDLNRVPESFFKLDWVAGKANDTCCPMGPAVVPAAFLEDPQDLPLLLKVNGETKQNARTSGMIFSIAEQIAKLSRIMTLDPGDVVLTGTPAGVGAPKSTFLKVGDKVDATIDGIGTLSVEIMPPA